MSFSPFTSALKLKKQSQQTESPFTALIASFAFLNRLDHTIKMSYWTKWRKVNREVKAILDQISSEEEPEDLPEKEAICVQSSEESDICPLSPRRSSNDSQEISTDETSETEFQISDTEHESPLVSSNESETEDLGESIASWATRYHAPREGINEMLDILRKHGHCLPSDARTLMKTPRVCNISSKCGGQYTYFGMESGILKVLAQSKAFCQKHESIHLSVNIDGVPLFKSTNDQMWPILCSFHTFRPFIVALFCGKQKPDSVTNFHEDFLADYTNLSSTGVNYHDKVFSVCIKTFICDAPARAFLKSIKGHTGYFSCERCCIRGSWNGRVVFNTDEKFPLRKDEDFSEMKYKDHQIQKSPLVDVGINCVSSFVL